MFRPNLIMRLLSRSVHILVPPLALMLGSCTPSTGLVEAPPVLIPPPDPLLRGCDQPHLIQDKDISTRAIVRLWSRDRISLFDCAQKQAALSDYIQGLEKMTSYSPDIQNHADMINP